ncbi:MAG TPA: sigma-70 family RNA polymerase sigma factor [Candidatus Krumholzibacteria bacterium]
MELDERDLVERVRHGDAAALRRVVESYLPQVLRAARGAGLPPEEAEDVTQVTFMTFLQTLDRFEGRSRVRTWIFGILYRKIAERRRQRGRDDAFEDVDQVVESRFDAQGHWSRPPAPPDQATFDRQLREHLDHCMEELTDRHRMAFVLREMEGLESGEICNILEISRTNLGVLLHRARNALRECLEARGIDRGGDAQLS